MRLFRWISALALALSGPAAAQGSQPSFVPVLRQNFPDAFVLPHGSEFIAYSTNDGPNVPVAVSRDLVHWSIATDPTTGKQRDAMPRLGVWAKTGFTWAPEVMQLGDKYLLYYTASDRRKNALPRIRSRSWARRLFRSSCPISTLSIRSH